MPLRLGVDGAAVSAGSPCKAAQLAMHSRGLSLSLVTAMTMLQRQWRQQFRCFVIGDVPMTTSDGSCDRSLKHLNQDGLHARASICGIIRPSLGRKRLHCLEFQAGMLANSMALVWGQWRSFENDTTMFCKTGMLNILQLHLQGARNVLLQLC